MKFSASSSSSDDEDLNSSRLEIYTGAHVIIIQSCQYLLNVKCCEEFPDLLKDKLDDACITDHKDFYVLCLHKSVLETVFIRHHRYKNKYTDGKEMTLNYAVVN